ncbi:MAG: P1 family peptidase [Anaerolineae bacterium]
MNHRAITDVPGIKVGHWTDREAATGCTVILCEAGAVGGVDVRGSAPGTRETDLLRPTCLVEQVHAVVLSGGSAFGLASADGVMRYLEEREIGYDARGVKVPIVPAAILFDLTLGQKQVRPDAEAGYQACLVARGGPVTEGSVGAGTGATVGKIFGLQQAMKGGVGTASEKTEDGIVVGTLVTVNALGDVMEPGTGQILAGARHPDQESLLNTLRQLKKGIPERPSPLTNTTIGVIATNARLTKAQANKVAQMAQDGVALAVRPAHTMYDGDALFVLSLGEEKGDVTIIGALAAELVARAIVRAVTQAEGLHGIPSYADFVANRNREP